MADRTVVVRLIANTADYEAAMRRAAGSTEGLNQSGQRSIVTLGKLGTLASGFVAASVLKSGVSFEALKQTSQAAFTTMLGSAGAARAELQNLYDFALKTPFAYPMILQASQQLTAYGLSAEKLIPTLHAVGDATAAMGGSAEIFQRVITAVGQIQAKGTVQAEEFRQLAEAGIPAWQFLANYLGTTVPEAMSRVEKRAVSSQQGIAALTTGIEQKFGGSMDALGNTWNRSVDRFTSSARRFGADVMAPIMDAGQSGMQSLTTLMNGLGPKMGSTLGALMAILAPLFTGLGSLLGLLGKLPTGLLAMAVALGVVKLAAGMLNTAQTRVVTSTRSMMANWAAAGALANETGARFGRLGVIMQTTGLRARTAGRSVLGAFGGPVGLAIIGVTTLLGFYSANQAKAKEKAQEHQQVVDQLTLALDKNTLAINVNGRADIDKALASDKISASGKTVIDTLTSMKINVQAYRNALAQGNQSGSFDAVNKQIVDQALAALQTNKTVLAEVQSLASSAGKSMKDYIAWVMQAQADSEGFLNPDLNKVQGLNDLLQVYQYLQGKTGDLATAQKELADAMGLKVPDAAKAVGDSASRVQDIFNSWVGSGRNLGDMLEQAGFSASQTSTILLTLGASAADSSTGFDQLGNSAADAAAKARSAIASAAASFVSPVGAWDAVVQRKSAAPSGGGGGGSAPTPKKPKVTDDPAVKSTTSALKAYDRQRKGMNALAKQAEADAKKYAKAEKSKADAAKKTADALKKAADSANEALKKAQDRKTTADRDAQDAANILAAVQHAQLQAGTRDTVAWASAVQKAQTADAGAKSEQISAASALMAAHVKVTDTTGKLQAANVANTAAQARSTAAQNVATAATTRAQQVQQTTQAAYQKLLDAKNAAEDKARQSTESMATGGSSAVGGMVKDVKVSLAEYLAELRKQVKAQEDWKDNLLTLAAKVPPGVLEQLAQLGPGAAPLVAQLVTGTDAQLKEFTKLFPQSTTAGVKGMTDNMVTGFSLLAEISSTAGGTVASKYAKAIKDGKITVQQAIDALKGTVDKDTLEVKLKDLNTKQAEQALEDLLRPRTISITPKTAHKTKVNGYDGVSWGYSIQGAAYAEGGWVKGGSGNKDDVPIPGRGGGLMAMGGEFMVRKSIAQANKPFFDYLDKHGKMPPAPVASPSVSVSFPSPVQGAQTVNHITVYQQPGQSANGLVREIDRLADLGSVR